MADQEQKVTINGTEYLLSELSDEAKAQLQSLQFTRVETQRLEAQLAIVKTAAAAYQRALAAALPKQDA